MGHDRGFLRPPKRHGDTGLGSPQQSPKSPKRPRPSPDPDLDSGSELLDVELEDDGSDLCSVSDAALGSDMGDVMAMDWDPTRSDTGNDNNRICYGAVRITKMSWSGSHPCILTGHGLDL